VFNPGSTSVIYGFLGLKLYFLYIPLMYLGYALIKSEQDLRHFFTAACRTRGFFSHVIQNPGDLPRAVEWMQTVFGASSNLTLAAMNVVVLLWTHAFDC
jgi:hypothetical protein